MVEENPDAENHLLMEDLLTAYIHDLNNAQQIIIGNSNLLLELEGSKWKNRDLASAIISASTCSQRRLEEAEHMLGRFLKDDFKSYVSEFDIFEQIDWALEDFLPKEYGGDAACRHVHRISDIPVNYHGRPYIIGNENPSVKTIGEKILARMVLTNLFSNATKYGKTAVDFDVKDEDGEVKIVIENDISAEIPKDYQEKLFQYHYRIPGTEKPGWGLGLYTARKMARSQGGDVWFESRGNVVSAYFTLPSGQKATPQI